MDVGDIVLGGALVAGGYVLYRMFRDSQAADAAPGTATGAAASNMTATAAASTTFANNSILRRLLPPHVVSNPIRVLPATASAAAAVSAQHAASAVTRLQVAAAARTPTSTTAAPSATHNLAGGGLAPMLPTQPKGDSPQPGDPSPVVTRVSRGLRL